MGHCVYVPTGGEPRLPIPELDPASGVLTRKGEIELRPRRRHVHGPGQEGSCTSRPGSSRTSPPPPAGSTIGGLGALEPAAEYDVGAPCAWVLPAKVG